MTKELGIDEAGRGPVLGPLVIAGVVIPVADFELLKDWGVADSKVFGSSEKGKKTRQVLADRIKEKFSFRIISLSAQQVDHYVENYTLNLLEQVNAKEILNQLHADRVVLDGKSLFAPLVDRNIIAENKADQKYISVAAASVLAKAERDRQFSELCWEFRDTFGEIKGGGYANGKTLDFVNWHIKQHGYLPDFYRKSYRWKALK